MGFKGYHSLVSVTQQNLVSSSMQELSRTLLGDWLYVLRMQVRHL